MSYVCLAVWQGISLWGSSLISRSRLPEWLGGTRRVTGSAVPHEQHWSIVSELDKELARILASASQRDAVKVQMELPPGNIQSRLPHLGFPRHHTNLFDFIDRNVGEHLFRK